MDVEEVIHSWYLALGVVYTYLVLDTCGPCCNRAVVKSFIILYLDGPSFVLGGSIVQML